jgi:hypothetical protein
MPDNDTRSISGRGAVRLENDRICVFERNGVYQARIRTEANRYLWRSLKTRNQVQAISAARRLFHLIEFRQQSGLPLTNRSVNRVIDEYIALRERQQTQGRTSFHMLRQFIRREPYRCTFLPVTPWAARAEPEQRSQIFIFLSFAKTRLARPLFPPKQTFPNAVSMVALCQLQTSRLRAFRRDPESLSNLPSRNFAG